MSDNIFAFIFFPFFFVYGLSENLEFFTGLPITIPFPPVYQEGLKASAVFLGRDDYVTNELSFKAALHFEAIDKKYACSLVVFLGDVKVWASDHMSKFWADTGCVVELVKEGDLQVRDWNGRVGWRTGTSGLGVKTLKLQKISGNLILTTAENQTKWQSFDFPTDTLLWSQQLNALTRLTAFPSPSSPFYYSLQIHNHHLGLYLNFKDQKYSYWELRPLSNSSISFIRLGSTGLKLFNNNSRKIGQILATSKEAIRFLALNETGNLKFYHATVSYNSQVAFKSSYQAIDENEICNLPAPCGLSKICMHSTDNNCWDLPREKGNWTGSCNGSYNSEMEMIELEGVYTTLSVQSPRINLTKAECVSLCLEECECVAAQYSEQVCSLYGLVAGAREVERGEEFSYWVKVAKDGNHHRGIPSNTVKKIVRFAEVVNALAICIIVGGFLYWFLKIRKRTIENTGSNH